VSWDEIMRYIRVHWHHSFPDEPVILFSEIDNDEWERRKVWIFRQGPAGYAGLGETSRGVELAPVKIQSLAEISADSQFEGQEISEQEFEEVWTRAHDKSL